MTDFLAWLLEKIAEDERIARECVAAESMHWKARLDYLSDVEGLYIGGYQSEDYSNMSRQGAVHVARWDPARVLAECEVKREIVDEHRGLEWHVNVRLPEGTPVCSTCGDGEWYAHAWPCLTLRYLALGYAARSGFRQEWLPDA